MGNRRPYRDESPKRPLAHTPPVRCSSSRCSPVHDILSSSNVLLARGSVDSLRCRAATVREPVLTLAVRPRESIPTSPARSGPSRLAVGCWSGLGGHATSVALSNWNRSTLSGVTPIRFSRSNRMDDFRALLFPASSPPASGLTADSRSYRLDFATRFFQLHLAATPCVSLRLPSSLLFGSFSSNQILPALGTGADARRPTEDFINPLL